MQAPASFCFSPCSSLQLCYGAFHHHVHTTIVIWGFSELNKWVLDFRRVVITCVWPSGADSITVYPQVISFACPYLWLQITELQSCFHIRAAQREAREQQGSLAKVIKGSCWTEKSLCVDTQGCNDVEDVDPAPCPGLAGKLALHIAHSSHRTGVTWGNIASPQLLNIRDLVLELQPVKMLSCSETFEKGFLYFVSERDFPFCFFLLPYL